ncbi:MAG: bifunctional demethylmenaquinone methyltransferase/2-methoxy-6-polyprenyl-1,4-benzoquinol methylase [Gammaproteobacteria bacterium]|nr:bifunctional demethylmenaquinone methyltransferase/2-methoxy-6-polyprenyl-1,4-benzoquinol methylase [Gammaproteobacteria bacterium]|tara:strand:+ start:2292 stop:3053 length:762 start_codon:yes stop_codon:yes gene_type:complete
MNDSHSVDFGHRKVTPDEKTRLVGDVFEQVAQRYDVMNDLMSLGTHRLFKRMTVEMSGARPGHRVLDLAGGTGDMAALFANVVGPAGSVVLADINPHMMDVGRERLLDRGLGQVTYCQSAAESLPFAEQAFDCAVIAFGLRNFTDKHSALAELCRVLKPGAALLVLEFSKAENPLLQNAYAAFQALWPGMGKLVTGDAASYQYLVESIAKHPGQKALKVMLEDVGFADVEYHNLLGGIAAIHRGVRPPDTGRT